MAGSDGIGSIDGSPGSRGSKHYFIYQMVSVGGWCQPGHGGPSHGCEELKVGVGQTLPMRPATARRHLTDGDGRVIVGDSAR